MRCETEILLSKITPGYGSVGEERWVTVRQNVCAFGKGFGTGLLLLFWNMDCVSNYTLEI